MNKVLYIILISLFSLTIISCGKKNSTSTSDNSTSTSESTDNSKEWKEYLGYQFYYKDREAVKIHGILDANNDKNDDLLLIYQAENKGKAILLINNGQGKFTEKEIINNQVRNIIRNVGIGDFNGDSRLDIFGFVPQYGGVNEIAEDNVIIMSSGENYEMFTSPIIKKGEFTHGGDVGDLDNDGDIDIYVVNQLNEGIPYDHYILLNDGLGNFTIDSKRFDKKFYDGGVIHHASIADFDNDGHLDIGLTYGGSIKNIDYHNIRIAYNDGNGFFNFDNSSQYGFHYAKDIDQPWVEGVGGIDGFETALISPTDFNQDGKLDMVVAQTVVTHGSGWTSTHIQLLKNEGNRKFSDITSSLINNQKSNEDTQYDCGWPEHVGVADINLDGINDIIIATGSNDDWETAPYPEYPFVFYGQNDGTFLQATRTEFNSFGKTVYLRPGNFNDDNKTDLVGIEIDHYEEENWRANIKLFINQR